MKTELHWFFPGQVRRVEERLRKRSLEGLRPHRMDWLLQTYDEGGEPACFRVGYARRQEAAAYAQAQQSAGWTLHSRKGCWFLFSRPWDGAEPAPRLEGDRANLQALFARRGKVLETLRRICLLLTAALFLAGYALDLRWLIYGGVVPLALCIPMTYTLKFMEELD